MAALSVTLVGQGWGAQGFALEGALHRLSWSDETGLAALACHLLPCCRQTFPLHGNMPEIAPLQIVFI